MKNLLLLICCSISTITVYAQNTADMKINAAIQMAETVVAETSLEKGQKPTRYNQWMYQNYMIGEGIKAMGEALERPDFSSYRDKQIMYFCEEYKNIEHFTNRYLHPATMWHCGMVAGLVDLSKKSDHPEIARGISYFQKMLNNAPKVADGTLARYKSEWKSKGIQIDDLYMVSSYWVRKSVGLGESKYLDLAIKETLSYYKHLWNPQTKLFHCLWVEKRPETRIPHWARGNGWFVMAITDLLNFVPENHPKRSELLEVYNEVMLGIMARQNKNGLWHQVLDHPKSYTETSSSGMFTYCLLRGSAKGWLPASARTAGLRGWNGLQTKLTDKNQLKDVCVGTDMSEDVKYYFDRKRVTHDQHGIGPYLLAAAEVINADATKDSFAKKKPNVLFIAVDDLNDWVGYLKEHPQAQTPHIDKLAGESHAFTRAYCSAPLCGPSRTSLMYGIYPHRTGTYFHHPTYSPEKLISPERIPLQLAFQKNGYYTSGSGKIFHYPEKRGWDNFVPRRKNEDSKQITYVFGEEATRPLKDFRVGVSEADPDSNDLDGAIVNWAIDQLKVKHKKPFFMAVGLVKPHSPWVAPKKFYDQYDAANIELPEVPENDLDDIPDAGKYIAHTVYPFFKKKEHEIIVAKNGTWEKLIHAYLATCSYADYNVGRILKALEESPYAKNTIIVLWGDHGWHLGEKEHWRKMTLWEQGTRVPFLIKTPGMTEGKIVNAPVSLQDIYPTLVDLCKLDLSQELDGNSLKPLLNKKDGAWDKPVLISYGPGNFAVRQEQWKLIRYANGSEEFYDIGKDPNEYANLAGNPEFQTPLAKLRSSIPKTWKYIICPRTKPFENTLSKPHSQ
ncbi:MAG: sulfatase-like hydrolase/transferase [Maribacter sp.]|nr:sulfatase-like hydrolase/transferase [Maribacter sp.]